MAFTLSELLLGPELVSPLLVHEELALQLYEVAQYSVQLLPPDFRWITCTLPEMNAPKGIIHKNKPLSKNPCHLTKRKKRKKKDMLLNIYYTTPRPLDDVILYLYIT